MAITVRTELPALSGPRLNIISILVLVASAHEWWLVLSKRKIAVSSEVPFTQVVAATGD